MTTAFVLGNGISRRGVPLNNLQQLGRIYGCNALYRDFVPDVLISTDKAIAEHIQNSGYAKQHRFHTRKPLADSGAQPVPQKYYGFSSGPIAVSLAALDQCVKIYLLGFDMGPAENNKFNNVYAGTEFYKAPDSVPTYTGNWIKQMIQITQDFPSVTFVRVNGATTANIKEFENIKNLRHLAIATFLDRINTQKDL